MNCKELHKLIIKFTEKELTPEKENELQEHIKERKPALTSEQKEGF
ncbi:MAG: hypothetical protein NTV87_10475 [Ignavibacteriae bacterium]|nr:hypothetical protein [Ignavibacteriota bacterium]